MEESRSECDIFDDSNKIDIVNKIVFGELKGGTATMTQMKEVGVNETSLQGKKSRGTELE